MKQQVPKLLVLIFGVFMVFQFFVPHASSEWIYEFLLDWILIIGVFWFKEQLSVLNVVGIGLCLVGVFCINSR